MERCHSYAGPRPLDMFDGRQVLYSALRKQEMARVSILSNGLLWSSQTRWDRRPLISRWCSCRTSVRRGHLDHWEDVTGERNHFPTSTETG
jgi:hypothetical protein